MEWMILRDTPNKLTGQADGICRQHLFDGQNDFVVDFIHGSFAVGPPADLTCLGSCFSPLVMGENPGGLPPEGLGYCCFGPATVIASKR